MGVYMNDSKLINVEIVFSDAFHRHDVNKMNSHLKNYENLTLHIPEEQVQHMLPPPAIAIISLAIGTIASGILRKVGADLWDNIKKYTIEIIKQKNNPSLIFELKTGKTNIFCNVESNDAEIIEHAFNNLNDLYNSTIKKNKNKEISSLYFNMNLKTAKWEEIEKDELKEAIDLKVKHTKSR